MGMITIGVVVVLARLLHTLMAMVVLVVLVVAVPDQITLLAVRD
jgi:hypothetical protein